MIRYTLQCEEGHVFDSWFQSASAYETLEAAGHIGCTTCGTKKVKKSLMTPRVSADITQPKDDPKARAIAELRREVEQNATYVGGKFAEKAREIHAGTAPEVSIYGEASLKEARALIEDGVPVLPLPFKPKQKLQ